MSEIDWADPKRTDVFHFMMVDPNNLNSVYGELEDIQLGSVTIIYGYYTDTRYSSQITFLDEGNYIENAWIRIIHEIPKEGYTNELGTFIPTAPNINYKGAVTRSFSLQSPLWGISANLTTSNFTIAKNTKYTDAFKKACNNCSRPYILNSPNDKTTNKAIVYEAGTSYLDILNDMASTTKNRVDLDGHGRITFSPLADHKTLTPIMELDADDPRSMIIENSVKMEREVDEVPNRIVVVDENYVGYADLAAGSRYSISQRGYVKAVLDSGTDIKSNAAAKTRAENLLKGYEHLVHWTMDVMYFPCQCGDNVYFIIDGQKHLCMIQSIDPLKLDTMTMTITIREVET